MPSAQADAIEVRPADSFADVALVLAPRNPDSLVCWCLTYRLDAKGNRALDARGRARAVEDLTRQDPPPGVLAHVDGEVAGWAGVAPRADLHTYATSARFPHVDDLPVWIAHCFRVRGGFGGRGVAHALLRGAVDFAREHGAPAIEGYPVDNHGAKVDRTLAYVGTRALFEAAGFAKVADTTAVSAGMPRVVMRLDLR